MRVARWVAGGWRSRAETWGSQWDMEMAVPPAQQLAAPALLPQHRLMRIPPGRGAGAGDAKKEAQFKKTGAQRKQ